MCSNKEKCGRCTWCVKDDGSPYCLHKDLYTTVEPDRDCDETDHYGRLWFIEEKKDEKTTTNIKID